VHDDAVALDVVGDVPADGDLRTDRRRRDHGDEPPARSRAAAAREVPGRDDGREPAGRTGRDGRRDLRRRHVDVHDVGRRAVPAQRTHDVAGRGRREQ
jgi:hypothetical protein